MRFLLDENIHAKLGKFLRSCGHDARPVDKRIDDRTLALHAKEEERIIITHDKDFADHHKHPQDSHCGVILVRINSVYLEVTKQKVVELLEQIPEDRLKNGVVLVTREGYRELPKGITYTLGSKYEVGARE
jgi:predicted nuclease of predicted toxin-antitoxin system